LQIVIVGFSLTIHLIDFSALKGKQNGQEKSLLPFLLLYCVRKY
jgi:hypothetical protein